MAGFCLSVVPKCGLPRKSVCAVVEMALPQRASPKELTYQQQDLPGRGSRHTSPDCLFMHVTGSGASLPGGGSEEGD